MISIIIPTHGDFNKWDTLAKRAVRSAVTESDDVIRIHGKTLASARNDGAKKAKYSRIMFLDADDEILPGFSNLVIEEEDILQPRTLYVKDGVAGETHWIEPFDDLLIGNHIIVGAPVLKEPFMDVGGFDEYPIFEDWALWLKMRKAGATFGKTQAIYKINVTPGSMLQGDWGNWIDIIRRDFS